MRIPAVSMQKTDAHTKRQITKRQTHKTADLETAEAQNVRSIKRQKAQNGRSSKRQKLKTSEGTKRQKAQNGRKHKTADDFYILIFILCCNVQANGQFLLITTTALQYDTPHIALVLGRWTIFFLILEGQLLGAKIIGNVGKNGHLYNYIHATFIHPFILYSVSCVPISL
jgi:Flp pilus assembly protein TadB